MPLRVRHGARIEPAVDHFGNPPPGLAVALERHVVHGGTMQVEIGQLAPGQFLEFGDRTHAVIIAFAVGPDRQRRAPEALARQRPVDVVLEPVAEAAVADVLRHPVDRLVELGHALAKPRRADVPGVLGVVEDRVAGAPAERVVVLVALRAEHETTFFQDANQRFVGVLEEQAGDRLDLVDEVPVEPDAVHDRQSVRLAELEIVNAIRWCRMHDAGTVFGADEIGRQHGERLVRIDREIIEQLLVARTDKGAAFYGLDDLVFDIAKHRLAQRLGDDQRLPVRLAVAVVDVLADGERQVRRQRPRRRRPDEKVGVVDAGELEAHRDRRVLDFLVAERQLVRRQRGADARIVGHDLVAAIDQVLVPDLSEQVPDRFDVAVVERVIGLVEIHPEAHALGHLLPVADVAHDRLAAAARELGDTDFLFDFLLVENAKLFLYLVLNGEPVRVPARFTRHVISAHRLVARKNVLEAACQHMMDAGLAVGRRRALVETELRPVARCFQRLRKNIVLGPERQHLLLEVRSVVAALHFIKYGFLVSQTRYSEYKNAPGASCAPGATHVHRGTTRFRGTLSGSAAS